MKIQHEHDEVDENDEVDEIMDDFDYEDQMNERYTIKLFETVRIR